MKNPIKAKGLVHVAASLVALGLSHGASALPTVTNGLQQAYEFSGNLNDSAGSNNATPAGNPGYTTDRNGNANSALALNGNGQYVTLGTPNVQSVATISLWMKPTDVSGDRRILSNLDGQTYGPAFALYFDDSHNLDVWSNEWLAVTSTPITANVWTNVILTINGRQATAYINGVQALTVTEAQSFSIDTLGLGARFQNAYGNTFQGSLDDIYLYNRVLSTTEITSLYNGAAHADGSVPEPSSLFLGALGLAALAARRRGV